jgi:hypothetical protein
MSFLRMDSKKSLILALLAGMMMLFSCPGPVEGGGSGGGSSKPSQYTFFIDVNSYPDMETFSLTILDGTEEVFSKDYTMADLDNGKGTIPASSVQVGTNTFIIEASDAKGEIYYRGDGSYTLSTSKTSFEITLEEIKVRPLSISQTRGLRFWLPSARSLMRLRFIILWTGQPPFLGRLSNTPGLLKSWET